MPRSLGTDIDTAIDDNVDNDVMIQLAIGLFLDIDGDPTYLHTGEGTITFDGNDWIGVGTMGEFTGINEGGGDADYQIRAVLNHIDHADLPDFVTEFATNNQVGRDYELFFIVFDTDGSIYFYMLSAGFMDATTIKESEGSGSIEQILSNETTKLKWKMFRRLAHQTQQEIYPTDDALEYLNDTQLQELTWGPGTSKVGEPFRGGGAIGASSGQDWCFAIDMSAVMADGQYKFFRNVQVGDEVRCFHSPTFLPEDGSDSFMKYSDRELHRLSKETGVVTGAEIITVPNYYLIDGEVKVTGTHPFIAYRDQYWQWIQTQNLLETDILLCERFKQHKILSIKFINEPIDVMKLTVDKYHNYFGGVPGSCFGGHNK